MVECRDGDTPTPPGNCSDTCRIQGMGTPPPENGTKVEGRGGDLLISRGKVYLEIVYREIVYLEIVYLEIVYLEIVYLGKLKKDCWTTLYLKLF